MGDLKNPFGKATKVLLIRNPKTYDTLKEFFLAEGASEAIANDTVKWIHDTLRRGLNQENHTKEFLKELEATEEEVLLKQKTGSDLGEPED